MPTALLRILAGLALLTLGRRLFWLFVGLVGFVAGIVLATQFVQGPEWEVLLIALAAGLLGVLFALVLQQAAVALAGFIAGGYLVITLLNGLRWDAGGPHWALYWTLAIVGGIVGAVLVLALFEWALIILSSLTGAVLIVQTIHPGTLLAAVLIAVLFIVGVIIQAGLRRRAQPPPAPPA
jgi:peptidoglycan biosynthesis protein MviN/MurJ (putative lipid II flippase)